MPLLSSCVVRPVELGSVPIVTLRVGILDENNVYGRGLGVTMAGLGRFS
jgi:hypothetical protein